MSRTERRLAEQIGIAIELDEYRRAWWLCGKLRELNGKIERIFEAVFEPGEEKVHHAG